MIEVSLPLEAINKASAREKSIRHGHPSTLHLWWARRPLAACRAVLFAQFVDDPSAWPEEFPTEEDQARERRRLHGIIEEMVPWEATNNELILNKARNEIARSIARNRGEEAPPRDNPEAVLAWLAQHAPPVRDPFCGGGSIPLEAQRLGLRAHGSDLNPVAVLVSKATCEIPPKFAGLPPVNPNRDPLVAWRGAQGLAEDIRHYGKWMRDEAESRIGHLYPKVAVTEAMAAGRPDLQPHIGQELTVIAWLWARTVASPDPIARSAHVPPDSMHEHRSTLRQQVVGHGQPVTQVAQVRVDAIAPSVPKRLHLLGLTGDVLGLAVLHVAAGGGPLKVGVEADAVGRVDIDALHLAAQALALRQRRHHLQTVAEDHAVRPVGVVFVKFGLGLSVGKAVEIGKQVRCIGRRPVTPFLRLPQQVVDQNLGMHLLLDVEQRRLDDEIGRVLLVLAAPDELRI